MAWYWTDHKPLPESMIRQFSDMYVLVTYMWFTKLSGLMVGGLMGWIVSAHQMILKCCLFMYGISGPYTYITRKQNKFWHPEQ